MAFTMGVFALLPAYIYFLAYRACWSLAPCTFYGFENRPHDFEPTLKRYFTIAKLVLGLSTGSMVFLVANSRNLVAGRSIKLWAPELLLFGICACLCVTFELLATTAYHIYFQGTADRDADEQLRRLYSACEAIGITALLCFALGYFGITLTLLR